MPSVLISNNSARFTPRSCLTCSVRGPASFCSLSHLALLDLQKLGTSLTLDTGAAVLTEGFSADRVFVICSGRVKLMASSAEGRLLILRIAGPGDVLGLASVLHGSSYRISAQTLEPTAIKSIPRADFLRFMQSSSDVSSNTTRAMAREYDAALLSARRLALSTSAAGKLAATLLDWARMGESPVAAAPLTFTMPLTHEELGSMAGLSRETVTRLLTTFRKQGLIAQHGQRLTLSQPQKLEALYC
jgi:CRP/FNR family transcriptional regulator